MFRNDVSVVWSKKCSLFLLFKKKLSHWLAFKYVTGVTFPVLACIQNSKLVYKLTAPQLAKKFTVAPPLPPRKRLIDTADCSNLLVGCVFVAIVTEFVIKSSPETKTQFLIQFYVTAVRNKIISEHSASLHNVLIAIHCKICLSLYC